jgi:putative ATP-dependent endonuclease of OLD family
VLVEGQTEGMSLPIYLMKAKLDVVKRGIAVVPVMGKGNLAKWWRFFSAFELPVYMILDNDDESDKTDEKRTDILATLNVPADEIESLLEGTTG